MTWDVVDTKKVWVPDENWLCPAVKQVTLSVEANDLGTQRARITDGEHSKKVDLAWALEQFKP